MGTHEARGSRWNAAAQLSLVAAALLLLLAGCGGSFEDPAASLAPFNDSLGRYLGPFKGGADVKVYSGHERPEGYVKDRVIIIEDRAIANWNSHLPGALRAATPDDVGTVVVVKESHHKVGKYSGGEPALQDVWQITVVDLAKGKIVGKAILRGDYPPTVADIDAGENYGPPPWEELLAYLSKLPRR